jgi:hypothetical protein
MKKFSITMVSLVTMAGFAVAQPKADPKTAQAGAATGSAAAPAPMVKPKPPAEIRDTLKMMGTRQNCTGVTWGGPDGKMEMKTKSMGTNALALDGWWIKGTSTMTMGTGKTKMTLKMDNYMTWDAKAGLWRSVGMANDGSVMVGTATMKDGKFEGTADMFGGMMGNGKWRDHGDMTDPKAGMKMWGEMSMDGRTWTKVYDMTCKKR